MFSSITFNQPLPVCVSCDQAVVITMHALDRLLEIQHIFQEEAQIAVDADGAIEGGRHSVKERSQRWKKVSGEKGWEEAPLEHKA